MRAGLVLLVALGAVAVSAVARETAAAVSGATIEVSDPIGDANFSAPAFQDVVLVQVTQTASGDFELRMEMAAPVPADPPLPPPGSSAITWVWNFDLDPTTFPAGYPYLKASGPAEFGVQVSWDGAAFAGTAIDRRPLLTGGQAILTPVPFSIDGAIVRADLASALIGPVPATFGWFAGTGAWSGPIGQSESHHLVDVAIFDP